MAKKIDLSQIKRILIVKLSAFGDLVSSLPALSAIRREWPHAEIAWLVEDRFKDLLENHSSINRLFVYERKHWTKNLLTPGNRTKTVLEILAFYRNLRRFKADIAFDFQGNLKGGVHAFFSGAKIRIGFSRKYSKEGNWLFATHRHNPGGCGPAEHQLSLLWQSGGHSPASPPFLPLEQKSATPLPPLSPHKVIVVHCGTSRFGAFKQWPLPYFEELCRSLAKETDATLYLTWGGSEKEGIQALVDSIALPNVRIAPPLHLNELPSFIAAADLFIGNDSGPTHLAALLGVPTLAIFGPKDPGIHRPYGKNLELLRNPEIPCNPCNRRHCPAPICLSSLLPHEVLQVALKMLQSRPDSENALSIHPPLMGGRKREGVHPLPGPPPSRGREIDSEESLLGRSTG